ncbi:hypothetical protein Tco_1415964 [Tanacetum coccineum]
MEVLVVLKVLEVAWTLIANHQNEAVGSFAISLVEGVRSNEGLTAAERVTCYDIPLRHLGSKSITYT